MNETIVLQLRIEELTYKLSELNSENADLKKQIHKTSQFKSHTNKAKIEVKFKQALLIYHMTFSYQNH